MRRTRRPRLASRATLWRNRVLETLARPFSYFSPQTRFILGFILLTLLTALVLARLHIHTPDEIYREGDIIRADIVAPADISIEDRRETERLRAEAANSVRPVWDYDSLRAERGAQDFRISWETLRQQTATSEIDGGERPARHDEGRPSSSPSTLGGSPRPSTPPAAPPADGDTNALTTTTWPGDEGMAVARAVIAHDFAPAALELITRALREANEGYVYDERDASQLKPEIRLINLGNGNPSDLLTMQHRFVPLASARARLRARLADLPDWTPPELEALASVLESNLTPTLVFNQSATEAARMAAVNSVAPATIRLKRNQVVAREGDTVTAQMLTQFAAIRTHTQTERRPQHFFGLLLIVAALYGATWRFTEYRSAITTLPISNVKAFTLVVSAAFVQLVLMRLGFIVADSIATQSIHPPFNDPTLWSFAIPFAAAALLVTLLVDTQLALITALLAAIFAGLLAPNGMLTTCYAMVSSSAAIYGIGRYRERHSVTLAGFVVGAVNALLALAVLFAGQHELTLNSVLLAMACGAAGGVLTTIFTAGGLPVNESFFGILTDIKLLELSNADLPVLGQLALRAPGTNQHSHAVGQLAEEACRAIGANALLARIGALYHDIGKSAAPEMFIENQTGYNPHDRLRPSQSARIITSHVTYGLKLAKEIGLPRQISDFIPQHHGTRTLHYFLRKAQTEARAGEVVDEQEFRYPGPKPQFKEAAIMMLADSCEAAARSLARPDPASIRAIISKVVEAIVNDGQLDECDLSLRELTKVRESITNSLIAIYHARIDYPGFNPPPLTGPLPPLPDARLDTEERGITYQRTSEVPINQGGEVEDEAVSKK